MPQFAGSDRIQSARVTATGTVLATSTGRMRSVYVRHTATAGDLEFRDGGAGGTLICTLYTPAVAGQRTFEIPGAGIAFGTDLHVTFSAGGPNAVTTFYAVD